MKCPMLMYNLMQDESPTEGIHVDCIKEGCAWFDKAGKCCSILEINNILQELGVILAQVAFRISLPKFTFRCHDCQLTVELERGGEATFPPGWNRYEQVDGKHVWVCDQCTLEEVEDVSA